MRKKIIIISYNYPFLYSKIYSNNKKEWSNNLAITLSLMAGKRVSK
jgi:hypothetical protein